MSLSSPVRNTALPLRIQERLNQMFARDNGFSGPQILDFFSRYDINIESYPSSGAPSRKQMFEDCLARFDKETQVRIVLDLMSYDGPMKHGQPQPRVWSSSATGSSNKAQHQTKVWEGHQATAVLTTGT